MVRPLSLMRSCFVANYLVVSCEAMPPKTFHCVEIWAEIQERLLRKVAERPKPPPRA
jgi:hypothetical protein